ncbi:MAG TPA: multiheme c-type cytochrome [Candidatus Acidoferrum sp.]|nr:multiheme c-type cytochrome [Candidatus Acidoferrum sp.]
MGTATCAKCHAKITATQVATPMANTLIRAEAADDLKSRGDLAFRTKNYEYRINVNDGKALLTVTDGKRTLTDALAWAFGTGKVGQSFLFLRNGNYYESRVTYFSTLSNLNFTPTRALLDPRDLEEARSRAVGIAEVQRCFSCHSVTSKIGEDFDTSRLVKGVTCEGCHGPGLKHAIAMEASALQQGVGEEEGKQLIFDPGKLSPGDAVDFCGSCHGTWWDIKLTNVVGIANVRAQPYRLMSSKCWGKGDPRIRCAACHDPHQDLVEDDASYDEKCLACHVATGAKPTADYPGRRCPVGGKNCAGCHMPKIEVPGMHHTFADHRIRIVKPGEPIPD